MSLTDEQLDAAIERRKAQLVNQGSPFSFTAWKAELREILAELGWLPGRRPLTTTEALVLGFLFGAVLGIACG